MCVIFGNFLDSVFILGNERELSRVRKTSAGLGVVWTETTLYLQFRLLLTTCRHNVTRDLRRCGAVAVKEFVGWSQKDIFPDFFARS